MEFGGIPQYQRQIMRVVEMQLEPPACTSRRSQASKMLTPRDLAREEGTCALQGQRRIPAAALFVYVPAPDHACCGNATRAPLLEPRGHFQGPRNANPRRFSAREKHLRLGMDNGRG